MNVVLPLKNTCAVQLFQAFETYVSKNYGAQAFKDIQSTIRAIQDLRLQLDYNRIMLSIQQDPKEGEKAADQILLYLRYCRLLQKRFRLEPHQDHALLITFTWNDSFNTARQAHANSMNYEVVAHMYNYAVVQYTAGRLYALRQTPEDRKSAIACLRGTLWAVQQLKQLVTNLPADVQRQHLDLTAQNFDLLAYLSTGIIYQAFYENFLPMEEQEGPNMIAQFAGEAGRNFQNCMQTAQVMLADQVLLFPQPIIAVVLANAAYGRGVMMAEAAKKMYKYYIQRHELETTRGHFGMSLGYLRKGREFIRFVLDNPTIFNALAPPQKEHTTAVVRDFESLLPAAEQRNAQIFRQRVLADNELPGMVLQDDQFKIKPRTPPSYEQALAEEQVFAGFLSEDAVLLVQQVQTFAEERKNDCKTCLTQLQDAKKQAYLNNFVNTYLDAARQQQASQYSQQQQTLPATIQAKLQRFRQLGSSNQIRTVAQGLAEMAQNCAIMLQNIRHGLDAEAKDDQQMRVQYQDAWTRLPSAQVRQEDMEKIKSYELKLEVARKTDQEIAQSLQRNARYLDLADKSDALIAAELPRSHEETVQQQFVPLLTQLQQLDQASEAKIEIIRQTVQQIEAAITNFPYMPEVARATASGVPQQNVLQTVLTPIAKMIENLNAQVGDANNTIAQICQLAQNLHQRHAQASTTASNTNAENMRKHEELANGFQNLVDTYELVNEGAKFYQQLTQKVCDLDTRVRDFLMTRAMEKEALINRINNSRQQAAPQTFGGFNQAVPNYFNFQQIAPQNQAPPAPAAAQVPQHFQQPFYQNGQFPKASSQFIPMNPNNRPN